MDVKPASATTTALQGLQKAAKDANEAAERIVDGELEAKDIVDLKVAETAFKANAKVAKVAREMEERLLDILS